MEAADLDLLLLLPGPDLLYLSGFTHGHAGERLLCLAVTRDGNSRWIVPAMNVEQIAAHVLPEQKVQSWTDAEGYLPALKQVIKGVRSVGFDDEGRAGFLLDLLAVAPVAHVRKASTILRYLRLRKDAAELAALRAAARTVDDTIGDAFALCQPGRREGEVDQGLRQLLLSRSPESAVAFTIVASGPNSALPHHETADRALQQGDVVVLDFGTRQAGYHSDITVVCSVGEPADPQVRNIYRIVWEAQQAALATVRPGTACDAVDRAARAVIESAGYGQHFLHRTGHGLGLQLHEPPFLVGGNSELLEEGMVFSVEPGIYLPGRFGVRLEVIATVTATGVELINAPSRRELPVV